MTIGNEDELEKLKAASVLVATRNGPLVLTLA